MCQWQAFHSQRYADAPSIPLPGQYIKVQMNLMEMIRDSGLVHLNNELVKELELMSLQLKLHTYCGVVYKVSGSHLRYFRYTHSRLI